MLSTTTVVTSSSGRRRACGRVRAGAAFDRPRRHCRGRTTPAGRASRACGGRRDGAAPVLSATPRVPRPASATSRREVVAARGVAVVPVERRARRATAAPRRPRCASSAAPRTASLHRRGPLDRAPAPERRLDLVGRPRRWRRPPRSRGAHVRSRPRSRTLLRPPASSTTELEALERARVPRAGSSPSSRRTYRTPPASPTELHAVGEPVQHGAASAHRAARRARTAARPRRRRARWRRRAAAPGGRRPREHGPRDRRAIRRRRRSPPGSGCTAVNATTRAPAHARASVAGHRRRRRSTTSTSSGPLVREDARLGRGVVLERPVPVEVVVRRR